MALGESAESRKVLEDERLARISAAVPIAILDIGADGELRSATPYFSTLCGLPPERSTGRGWLAAAHPSDRPYVERAWDEAIRSNAAAELRFRFSRPDNTINVRLLIAPLAEGSGFGGAMTNINEFVDRAAALEESARQFRLMVEAMPQLAWICASDGTVEYFNARWVQYTGITVDHMRQSGSPGVVHPEDLGATIASWNHSLRTGEPYEIEYRLLNKENGAYRWFIARATPLRDEFGHILHWIGTATDIDNHKRANANLRFVLDASSRVAALYDAPAICQELANVAIEGVADWCFVTLLDHAGAYRTTAIAHRDAHRIAYVEQFRDRYPVRPGSTLDECVRSNTPLIIASISAEQLQAAAVDELHLRLLQELQMRSVIIVPLGTEAHGAIGAITLVSSESGRSFTLDDLEAAQMVARRAAAAINTARIVEEERLRSARLQFIARASELMFESLDIRAAFDNVTALIVSEMADLAYVTEIEDGSALRTVSVAHRDPYKGAAASHLLGQRTLRPQAEERAMFILAQHRTIVQNGITSEQLVPDLWEYLSRDVRALESHYSITVPLHSRGQTLGALVACWCETPRSYTDADIPIFNDLGRRLSIAIEHVTALHRERRIAEALQHALLPSSDGLPQHPALVFSAEYRPSSHEAEVGGDWYDAVTLSDGTIMLSVGDVTGRGLDAAGMMGALRQAISMGAMHERDPAALLDQLDFQMRSRNTSSIATAFVGFIDPDVTELRFANAGHPPPLLRRGNEVIELLSGGLPLGLRDSGPPDQAQRISLKDAQLLALYTDGLIEGTRDLAFGEHRLRQVFESEAIQFVRSPAQLLCDACLPFEAQDDTAVLTMSFGRRTQWTFDADNAQAAHDARAQFIDVLCAGGAPDSDFNAAEVIFGELVGNVVRHAPGPIDVQLQWSHAHPVLHVTDRGRGFVRDPGLPLDPLSESGRGLYIVAELGLSLRIERIAGYGNHIAAELPVSRR
ncbi:MAG TPA: SpoIIE family protein phosphatase [Candidatus Baltobacteraceae bacterium]|nr:SpoIIE family protein phosphatase [Candidatus Baltobacteraceae bacterium]